MIVRAAFIVSEHWAAFRPGEAARIVCVDMVKPDDKRDWRPCYRVKYDDGYTDWIPIGQDEYRVFSPAEEDE